ncbi:solute carrier family 22 member 21-like [Zerene cesonia]|uniref:solute carrier family 22 member 21-like n=1 Tax=Zerene cesonia TaxID=33412 RepID=UPI0018E576EB|nr:solute carrier family 22 member 21-like [Zerene cesonia]
MDINYRCKIPQCEGLNDSLWIEFAIPKVNNKFEKCNTYEFVGEGEKCEANSFNRSSIVKCDAYVYSDEDSIVKDFDLACQHWKRTFVGSAYSAGFFIALPLTGVFSDNFGRVKAISVATAMYGVFGLLRSFSNGYLMFVMAEFLETASAAAAYSASFVFGMELVQPSGRVFGNTLMNFSYIFGSMTLPMIAWWLQNWRYMLRLVYTPSFIVISYLLFVNESPRWLLSKGRAEEAISIILKAEKMNNVKLPDHLLASLKASPKSEDEDRYEPFSSVFVKVVKSRTMLFRLILYCYLWITCSFGYYGLSINSVSLAGNKYLNFMLVAFIEMPANALCCMVLNKFGRKKVLITWYTLSAVFCISLSLLPKQDSIWPLIFYLAGKFSITVSYTTVYISVSEAFPTNARQSLLAVCSTTGRIGSTLAPLTPLLALYYQNLPTIFFGSLALTASVLSFATPETNNLTLPDNTKEAEKISK